MEIRVPVLLFLAVVLGACDLPAQTENEAIDKATFDARDTAGRVQQNLRVNLGSQTLAVALTSLPVNYQPGQVTVVDSAQQPSGTFSARLVIVGYGDVGSGTIHEEAAVRVCVKYSGDKSRVDIADTACPESLSAYANGVQVVRNVTLE
jgi:hypothetical protein